MLRNGAAFSCMSSTRLLARCDASGSMSTGPPRGPGLRVMTPWNSSSRNASRSVPRPVWYFSSIVRSGASRSPGFRPSRSASWTMRWATRSAALGGRVEVPLMVIDVRPSSNSSFMPKINMIMGDVEPRHMERPVPVNNSLGDEETVEALARLVREWGRERVRPFVQEREAAGEFPRDLYAEMGELGFFGCCLRRVARRDRRGLRRPRRRSRAARLGLPTAFGGDEPSGRHRTADHRQLGRRRTSSHATCRIWWPAEPWAATR